MIQSTYESIRDNLKAAYIVAWGGPGVVSEVIKKATKSNVSHISIVIYSMAIGAMRPIVSMIESTSINDGFSGVDIVRMSTAVQKYEGEVWVLPIREDLLNELNIINFTAWLIDQKGKPYDTPQAIMSAIDFVPDSEEDFSKLFCSELAAGGLKKGGFFSSKLVAEAMMKAGIDASKINASEQTPADVCRFGIYDKTIQIKGRQLELFR